MLTMQIPILAGINLWHKITKPVPHIPSNVRSVSPQEASALLFLMTISGSAYVVKSINSGSVHANALTGLFFVCYVSVAFV